jgi:hypothetical protein
MDKTSSEDSLFAIYLNDHLAGATAGTDLAKRLADAERDWTGGPALAQLAQEIEQDRETLVGIMRKLGVPVRQYKLVAAWLAEKVGRLKLNGRLVHRSPLSRVIELELMQLGVEGKAAGWRTLRTRAESDDRLDTGQLDELHTRARQQAGLLERLRVRAAAEVFGGEVEAAPFERRPAP